MVCKADWKNLRGLGRVFFEDFASTGCWVRDDRVGSTTRPTAGTAQVRKSGRRLDAGGGAWLCGFPGGWKHCAKAGLPAKNALLAARLWTSHWICTGSDVQKHVYCRPAVFSPTSVQAGYNPCPAGSRRPKLLILWRKFFLSTTTASFTITTSFIYTFITVNSKKREQRA